MCQLAGRSSQKRCSHPKFSFVKTLGDFGRIFPLQEVSSIHGLRVILSLFRHAHWYISHHLVVLLFPRLWFRLQEMIAFLINSSPLKFPRQGSFRLSIPLRELVLAPGRLRDVINPPLQVGSLRLTPPAISWHHVQLLLIFLPSIQLKRVCLL